MTETRTPHHALALRLRDQAELRERALAALDVFPEHVMAQARGWIADLHQAATLLQRPRPTWWRRLRARLTPREMTEQEWLDWQW